MKIRYFALVAVVMPMMSGCFGKVPPSAEEVCGSNIFNFHGNDQPLGAGRRLEEEIRNAAAAGAPTTLGDITRSAGWSDNWDRMIEVYPDEKVDRLNSDAQTDLPEPCWQGLPRRRDWDDPSVGYYLFLSNGRPVQAVEWDSYEQPPLSRHRKISPLTPLSALVVDKDGDLVPAG